MDGIIIALIGVCGTLAGTLLGWFLNSQSYKIGRTKIYATFVTSTSLPAASLDGSAPKHQERPKTEYLIQCVASNSRQVPVILSNFHVEMALDRHSKPINLSVVESEIKYTDVNGLKIGVQLALPRQLIPPHTLCEFEFKVDYSKPDIQYSRLKLVAYDEKHKRHEFLLYDGLKIKPPPK